jgi:hypothetical protein
MQIQGAQILNLQVQNQEAMDLSLRLQGPSAQATRQRNEEVISQSHHQWGCKNLE